MSRRKRGLILLVALLALIAVVYFFGFGGSRIDSYSQYQHPDLGFVLDVPEDWSLVKETADSAAWQSSNKDFAFVVMGQLGGYSYYDMNGMGDIMATILGDSISGWQEVSREVRKDLPKCYRIIGQGVDKDGSTVVTDGLILEPMQAVRFYAIAMGGPQEYKKYDRTLADIYSSFDVVLSQDELYTKMMELKQEQQESEKNLSENLKKDSNNSDS